MWRLKDRFDSSLTTTNQWEPRGPVLAIARTAIAIALLSEILFTPDRMLIGVAGLLGQAGRCEGIHQLGLWCVGDSLTGTLLVSKLVAIVVLALSATGFRPAWTCVPLWYVAFSLNLDSLNPSGGEAIAAILTLLLIPACLGDARTWQWRRPDVPMAPRWQGSSLAALIVIRLQLLIVYISAALSKLFDPAWRQGSALYFIAYDPSHGFPGALLNLLRPILMTYWVTAPLSWLVILVEFVIALAICGRRRARIVAVWLAVALHVAIAIFLGLPAFALVMIASVVIAASGRWQSQEPELAV